MAKITQYYRTPTDRLKSRELAKSGLSFWAGANDNKMWTRLSISVRNLDAQASTYLELDRVEAQRIVDQLTEYLTKGPQS